MSERAAEHSRIVWQLRHHYFCGACGWSAPRAAFDTEPVRCPRCGALPDGSEPWPAGTYAAPRDGWTCYHCGETFYNNFLAAQHFGAPPDGVPGCLLKVERGERGLLASLREAEAELARYRQEDTELHRKIARLSCEQGEVARCEEEKGYARGLRDANARAVRIAGEVKRGLRNGGARNACDAIAAAISDAQRD